MAAVFILRLTLDRLDLFVDTVIEQGLPFAEPVPEFAHSRNLPLVCCVVAEDKLLYLGAGRTGYRAGTEYRRLNVADVFKLNTGLNLSDISDIATPRLQTKIRQKFSVGGLLPNKSSSEVISLIQGLAPEAREVLNKYSSTRTDRIERLTPESKSSLAEQKEAVATALSIAGISRDVLAGWDTDTNGQATSFLDGLEQVRLREDAVIVSDLAEFPGHELVKTMPFSANIFENESSKLTVILANRLPLEQQTGTDLIYYNETFKCFLMIQYKSMEKEGADEIYRFPNVQLEAEIARMESLLVELKKCETNSDADGYRLSENPFFLKICPRLVFKPDNVGLSKGMYLPLDYWHLLSEHAGMIGPRGGKRISYKNVRRYLDNTAFINIASGGWVGTNISQSMVLEEIIRSTLESGRAAVIALNTIRDVKHMEVIESQVRVADEIQ